MKWADEMVRAEMSAVMCFCSAYECIYTFLQSSQHKHRSLGAKYRSLKWTNFLANVSEKL